MKLTVTLHVGGKQIEKLTNEQLDKMSERVGQAMSMYYTANPDEYAKLKSK